MRCDFIDSEAPQFKEVSCLKSNETGQELLDGLWFFEHSLG